MTTRRRLKHPKYQSLHPDVFFSFVAIFFFVCCSFLRQAVVISICLNCVLLFLFALPTKAWLLLRAARIPPDRLRRSKGSVFSLRSKGQGLRPKC